MPGTWSTRYFTRESFAVSRESMIALAERGRVQGTTWYHRELPVLHVRGDKHSLLIAEINTSEPLGRFRQPEALNAARTLRDIGRRFPPYRKNSVVRLLLPSQALPEPHGDKALRFTSFSQGGQQPLGWRRDEAASDVRTMRFLTTTLHDILATDHVTVGE